MSSGKSKLSAKTGALTQKDLDSFLALHVTAATDVYLQQLAHEVRRSHAAEGRVKTLELELLAADAALSRATESVNERDRALTHCYSQISELTSELDDQYKKLQSLRDIIENIGSKTLSLRIQQTKKILSSILDGSPDAMINKIRLELIMNDSVSMSFLDEWLDHFDNIIEKNSEVNQLFEDELDKFLDFIDKIDCD